MAQEKLFDIYTDYLISQNKYATATGLSLLLAKSDQLWKITRFLNKIRFESKDLWKYVKPKVLYIEKDNGGMLTL